MAQIGYHVSHEQFKPSELLKFAINAEEAGFSSALSSDHFHPWNDKQGESGFAWSWLGAAMHATNMDFGIVNAPGQRYHPAIIAQAAATLAEMFPNRFFVALGSGQALNEGITGDKWPEKSMRNARLKECVDIIRALWAGEKVNHRGLVNVENAKLYTRPEKPPLIIGAALTEETAEWTGSWADGLITISHAPEKLKKIVNAFRKGGGEGKPMYLKVQISYSNKEEKALEGAFQQWRSNIFESILLSDLEKPKQFETAANFVKPEDMRDYVRISSKPEKHIEWLMEDIAMGFEKLFLHNVNLEQELFIESFGEKVLPELTEIAVK
jgi:coenzyme F420-dependent glucose-6-phosphate dehydrogenase